MSKSATRGKISPLGLFYILFICRIVVSLTSTHSVSKTEINSQALISYILAMPLAVVFSLPAIFCCKKGKNPIDVKCVSKFYYAYFLIYYLWNFLRKYCFIFCFYNFKSGNTRLAFCSYSMHLCFLWCFFGDRSVIAIFRLLLCAFKSCRCFGYTLQF